MSTQYLDSSVPNLNIKLNHIVLDEFSRPADLVSQTVSPITDVDVGGKHTVVIQTQTFVTPYEEETRFTIKNLGKLSRSSWVTGDIVRCHIQTYSGFNGWPVISGEKLDDGGFSIKIANVAKTGSPPAAAILNGFFQISVELIKFDGLP